MMKRVLVEMDHMKDIPYMHIESMEDLAEYICVVNKSLVKTVDKIMKSDVNVEKWDHILGGKTLGDGAMLVSWLNCKYGEGDPKSPLIEVDGVLSGKFLSFAKSIGKGETILANYVGGYMTYHEQFMKLSPDETYVEPLNYHIPEGDYNAKYINLENDPQLEQHVKDWFHMKGPIAYVKNLRDVMSEGDLVKILERFKMKGGHTVYVYTTGIDVSQMMEYSNCIISAGIENVIFEFNAGITEGIKDVIDFLQDNEINTEYKEV